MIDFETSANGMNARIRQQEIIANNLANVNTVGFKKDRVSVFKEILNQSQTDTGSEIRERTSFDQGALRETKNPLDMALEGDGFFTIQTEEGIRYTRNGHFKIDTTGHLVLQEDAFVMGEGGPIEVSGVLMVNEKGELIKGDSVIGRFRVVTFPEPYQLIKTGNGLFKTKDESVSELPAETYSVKQGFVEESNVNAVEEMVNMMTLYRYFEADQKAIRTQDEIYNRAANDIGRV